jgi:hypothetical protein
MSDLEHVIQSFKLSQLSKAGGEIPAEYDPELWLKVYDKEQEYRPALITNISKTPDGYIAIEFKYTDKDDDTTWCYLLCDELDVDLPTNDGNLNYVYDGDSSEWFDYWFMTENRVSKYRDKIWPRIFKAELLDICLEYIETIDPSHSNYRFIWESEKEYIVTLSREDINELLNDPDQFLMELEDAIFIMKIDDLDDEDDLDDDEDLDEG